jgi:hypothetical protein
MLRDHLDDKHDDINRCQETVLQVYELGAFMVSVTDFGFCDSSEFVECINYC